MIYLHEECVIRRESIQQQCMNKVEILTYEEVGLL